MTKFWCENVTNCGENVIILVRKRNKIWCENDTFLVRECFFLSVWCENDKITCKVVVVFIYFIVFSLGKPNTLLSWYCLDRGMWIMVIENCIVSSYTIRQVDKWRGVIVKDEDMSGVWLIMMLSDQRTLVVRGAGCGQWRVSSGDQR